METCERLLQHAVVASAEASTPALLLWLQGCSTAQDNSEFPCSRSEFSSYFVNYVRTKTERFLKLDEDNDSSESTQKIDSNTQCLSTKDNTNNSPINCNKIDMAKFNDTEFDTQNSINDEKSILSNMSIDSTDVISTLAKVGNSSFNESFNTSSPNTGLQVKSEGSDTSFENNHPCEYFTTPKRNVSSDRSFIFSPVTPINDTEPRSFDNTFNRFSTPNTNRSSCDTPPNPKFNTSNKNQSRDRVNVQQGNRKPTNQRNICIGDFMMTNKSNVNENVSSKKKKSRFLNLSLDDPLINANKENTRFQNDFKNTSNLNIDDKNMFPTIGSHKNQNQDSKAGGYRQMRRIKPTRLNMTFPSEEQSNTNINMPVNMKFGVKYDKVEQNEAFKMQNCQIREHSTDFTNERDMLKNEKVSLIEKFNQINNITPKKILTNSAPVNQIAIKRKSCKSSVLLIFELKKVDNVEILNLFIKIFSIIIDSNLIPNVISELYYLISIAMIQYSQTIENISKNVEADATEIKDKLPSDEMGNTDKLLDNVQNCIYFALGCLERQRQLLNMVLDKHCLRLILQNERIRIFSNEFADFLSLMHSQKTTPENKIPDNLPSEGLLNRNVCFITDTDSADNFPSHQNFITFKSQRDGFYEILRMWEANHLLPGWKFDGKLGPKVRSLVSMSTSPSNLVHLARLFKSQLLVACNVQEKSESLAQLQSVIGSSGVSQNKLSKLEERLTSALPGQLTGSENILNTRPEFSGWEEFFRDFIIHSNNSNFREHLIDSIVQDIYKLDEAGFLPSENDDSVFVDKEVKAQYLTCVKSLRVLAKFLGFLMSLPYRSSEKPYQKSIPGVNKLSETNSKNDNIENSKVIFSEISVRNQTLPPINLIMIVDSSYRRHRLILTIPWVVQLLAMLDYCYLRLLYFQQLHETLFDIYSSGICKPVIESIQFTDSNVDAKYIIPYSNKSLVRICLGWLFDLEHFPQEFFYNWLKNKNLKVDGNQQIIFSNQSLSKLLANVKNEPVVESKKIILDHQNNDSENTERLKSDNLNDDDIKRFYNLSLEAKEAELELKLDALEIIDDSAVREICPFLKDFRLLFLKNQDSKNDRDKTRNIRHITPVTSSFNVDKPKRKDVELQMRLEEWFLRSQAGTTRRTLEIVSERTGSALIRLAKTQISTYCDRAYAEAQSFISDSIDDTSATKITVIYSRLLLEFHLGCKNAGQHVGSKRVRAALQGLLPPGTPLPVMEMCIQICTRNAIRKLVHCLESQYNNIQILFNNNNQLKKMPLDLVNDYFTEQRITMIHKHNKDNTSHTDSSKELVDSNNSKKFEDVYYSPTLLIIGLKNTILDILNGTENFNEIGAKVQSFFKKINDCTSYPHVDKFSKLVFLQLSIDLIICLICFNPSVVNEKYLYNAGNAWNSCCFSNENDDINKKSSISESEVAIFEKFMINTDISDATHKTIPMEQKVTSSSIKLSDKIGSNSNCDSQEEDNSDSALKDELFDSPSDDSSLNYFNTILCSRNLILLRGYWSPVSDESKWKALEILLIFLLKNNFLTEESLTEQCVAIYRQDWPQDFLNNVAKCIKNLVEKCQLQSNEKLSMMLEFVSDFCQNLDDDYDM